MTEQCARVSSMVCFAEQGSFSKDSQQRNIRDRRSTLRRRLDWVAGLIAAVAVVLVPSAAVGQVTLQSGWNQLSPTASPSSRYIHSMVYDAKHGQVVLFGGFSNGDLNDTWLFDGTTWTNATPSNPANSPSTRSATEMAYDPIRGQVVLFGGIQGSSTRLNDTWVWDGTKWTQLFPTTVPTGRASSGMVFDAAHGKIVMYGGISASGSVFGETWLWDGTNWTQASPAHNPGPRADYSMVYDAARGQVVLFGGEDQFLADHNDTWVWNGTDWTQLAPGNSPPARDAQGMAYDEARGLTVMFAGEQNPLSPTYLNDTWIWDGTNWTQQTTPSAPTGGAIPREMVYDAQLQRVLQFGGYSNGFFSTQTWGFGAPQNFGNVNVCPVSASTPAPCSITVPLTYNVATTTNFNVAQVVTQGTAGLDFSLGSSTCAGTVNPGATCTVNVKFAPTAPGLRMGAVNLVDSFNNVLISTPVFGNGQAPSISFGPGTQTTFGGGSVTPYSIAFDAAGNAFIATWTDRHVVKIAAGSGTQTTIYTGTGDLEGVAVDGAGNVYTADLDNNMVVEIPAGGGTPITLGSGLNTPAGVAVDGLGNVFVADYYNNRVVKLPSGGGAQTTVGSGLSAPQGVAVDAQGDVFIADAGNTRVVEVTPAGVQTTLPFTGLNDPIAVAVDAAGDVFVANYYGGNVFELTPARVQTTVASLGGVLLVGVGVNTGGDVFIADNSNGRLVEVQRSAPPTLTFTGTYLLITSSDSPQSVTIQNSGNQTLVDSTLNVSSNFFQVSGPGTPPDCAQGFSLVPGASCNLDISFTPLITGNVSGAVTLQDNALNGAPSVQSIPLSGTSLFLPEQLSISGGGAGSGFVQSNPSGINCSSINSVVSGTCSTNFNFNQQVALQEAPTNGSVFTGWGGACTSYGTSQQCIVTMSQAQSVTANFAPAALFNLNVTVGGTGSGTVTTADNLIHCGETNGTANPGSVCSANYSGSESLTATAGPGSYFAGWVSGCSGNAPNCGVTGSVNVTAIFVQQSFGPVNVCPKGQNSPAPCSGTLTIPFFFTNTTTLGAIQVVTQGTSGLDFTQGIGNSCTGTISPGNSCKVDVTFTPLAPGLRTGAITLYDNNGNQVATQAVYGVGQAPVASFGPAAVGVVNTTANYPLSVPNGVAVDAVGNLYIADVDGLNISGRIVKVGANGTVSTVGSGLSYPQGMAVDGAGNLFIADNNQNQVLEVTPAGVQTAMDFGLNSQLGVAVDGAGNLYVSSFGMGIVAKAPVGCTTAACTTVVYTAPSGLNPVGVGTDSAGNLYVTALSLYGSPAGQVVKIPPGCTNSSCQVPVGSGWYQPEAVAVDAAGNVFVADEQPAIIEVPAGCASSACQITLSNVLAFGIAVDAKGDVIIPDRDSNSATDPNSHKVIVLAGSKPPSPNFTLTNVGTTSSDSPQAVTLQNVGNQPLTGSVALSGLAPNFTSAGTCGSNFTLAPGEICSESFGFTPQNTGYFAAAANFSDNTMNLAQSVVLQPVNLTGTGGINGQAVTTAVPNLVGLTQAAASVALTNAGLQTGSISSGPSSVVPVGSVIDSNPSAGTQVALNSSVKLLVSSGPGQPPAPNPLLLRSNYFVTGDYAAAGVSLHGATPVNGKVSGTINIPASSGPGNAGVPTGADIVEGLLYWATLESSATPSGNTGTFLGYSIVGQQVGSDMPYTDGALSGNLRVYRASVNTFFQNQADGTRIGSGSFQVLLPGAGTTGVLLNEGASLVVIYRVLSPSFPLKAVVIYDGSANLTASTTQNIKGFYDAVGGNNVGELTSLFVDSIGWHNSGSSALLNADDAQYTAALNAGSAYGALILSTPVNNSDNDGILDVWKNGPPSADFHGGQPGYYDVKTGLWVGLPGAQHGHKDMFVQLDWMCGAVLSDGTCDPNQENFFPAPDSLGRDPLVMVKNAFAQVGVSLHLQIGNAVPEDTCVDSPGQPCQFPNQAGVIGWKNSLEFSKVWPKNFGSCAQGGDCSPRFAYGQKDSYHYVLFGRSLAIPAWNTRYGTLTGIVVSGGVTTITTTDRGRGINACPSRITIGGVQGNSSLNGVYNTASCSSTSSITLNTPGVPDWTYPNGTMPEPVIGIASGTVTSISGFSDLGGADSAVTLGLWETAPNQDMSKRANVVAGTLFHELGHTIGLPHGGIYYTPGSYVPTFEANCKPNYQSIMNYLFQLDGVGPTGAVAFSTQTLTTLNRSSLSSVSQLVDTDVPGAPATFPTSTWYVPTSPSSTASAATLHCDGTPLGGDIGYRITGPVAPIFPSWTDNQNIAFDGQPYSTMRGFNDKANIDLRQVGATGGQFAELSDVLAFNTSFTPLNIAPGGSVAVGAGGTITLGAGGTVTLGAGGNITLGGGGTVTLGAGGALTMGTGGTVTLGAGGTITAGTDGNVGVGAGNITLGAGGTITLGGGGNITLGAGGTVTLGAGGIITLPGGGGIVTIPSTGGSYTVPAGGTVTLGAGGNVTLGAGGNVTLGAGGTVTLGAGGTVTLGAGGNITLGAGGTITLGGGGNVTLGAGGNITLGAGGTVTLGAGGNVTLGAGGNVTLGAGGTVTLGAGGNVTLGAGGNVTLGAGGTVTLGAGGNITLGAGGNITLGAGGTVTLGAGGNVTLGAGGNITLGAGGSITMNAAGNVTLGAGGTILLPAGGGTVTLGAGGSYTAPAGAIVTPTAGGNITLGAGGNITLGGGGNITLGAGGSLTMNSGGNVTLGAGGTVTLGAGGNVTLGAGGTVTLGAGGNVTLGAGGNITLGGGGNVTLGGGGASTAELDYDTANSTVRPPASATYTLGNNGTVLVSWTPPAFGVVQSYTVTRGIFDSTTNTVINQTVIGTVTGVNGNPPVTAFTDTNPPVGTLIYTITTTLVPDPGSSTPRQSDPSPPAVLTINQSIAFGTIQSSYPATASPVMVTATSQTSAGPTSLLVSFAAAGACSVGGSNIDLNGVSSAPVTFTGTGSCTITASQTGGVSGSNTYNAATAVSASFAIVAQSSGTTPQIINFPALANIRYGSTFVLNATDNSGLPITYSASGPCTTAGTTTGTGTCTITATAAAGTVNNTSYSQTSAVQSFTVIPAILTVTAGNLTAPSGQVPSLTNDYTISGYVNGDSSSVVSGAPSLTTTATNTSGPAIYPITVTAGSLSASNYSFVFVNGTLTLTQIPLTITTNNQSMILNGTLPTFTATYSGFAAGDGPGSLSGTLTCTTTTNGKTIGTFPITCSGQTSTKYNITYKPGTLTVSYAATGTCYGDVGHQILQPINADGSSVFKANSTSIAKFRVCDAGGVSIGTPGVVQSFVLYQVVAGTTSSSVNEPVVSTTPDTAFRWDSTGQQWIYNINNRSLGAANQTYSFRITLNDGSTITFRYGLK